MFLENPESAFMLGLEECSSNSDVTYQNIYHFLHYVMRMIVYLMGMKNRQDTYTKKHLHFMGRNDMMRRRKIGDVYGIPLPDGTYAFGRVRMKPSVVFYKHRGKDINDLPPTEDYELYEADGFRIDEICNISTYEEQVSEKVRFILLTWACYGQNEFGILFGSEQIAKIPKQWLQEHLLTVVKNDVEYTDDWNYGRLLELVKKQAPELMKDVLLINSDTNNRDLLEVIEDFP